MSGRPDAPGSAPGHDLRASAPVAVVGTAPDRERVIADTRRAMELAEWRRFLTPGADISLKANLGWDKLIPGAISAPWVVEGVILTLREHAGEMFLVESDQVVLNVERSVRLTGLLEVCQRLGVRWCNMSRQPVVRRRDSGLAVLRDVNIPEVLTRTELVTLPLLKTHNKTVLTGALKNQWGCLESLRHHYHLVLTDAITDVNLLVQPRFAVMDGTVGLEGNGPKAGISREMNTVLASANLVGIDAVAAQIMGIDPFSVPHLRRASEQGLGSFLGDFAVLGDPVAPPRRPFTPARHNAVSWLELLLRRSAVQRIAFHSPLFGLLCWGARRYYDLWDLLVGTARRRAFLRRSGYAAQWRR